MPDNPIPRRTIARTLLLAVAATWLLLAAFMRVEDDSVVGLIGIVQRVALRRFALVIASWH